MKITVLKPELLAILSTHFGQNVTECVISKPNSRSLAKIEKHLANELSLHVVTHHSLQGSNKIPAIKALRSIIPDFGLAEGKWVVENWIEWTNFIKSHGRIPKFEGNVWNNPKLI